MSSYTVDDRVQEAEIDPADIPDEDEEEEESVCQRCHVGDDGLELLLCDECDSCWHIHCAGLQEVPAGDWFCHPCIQRRVRQLVGSSGRLPRAQRESPATARRSRPRESRRQQRRPWDVPANFSYLRRAVYSRTEIDLDDPDGDDEDVLVANRRQSRSTHQSPQRDSERRRRGFETDRVSGRSINRARETRAALTAAAQAQRARDEEQAAREAEQKSRDAEEAWQNLERAQNIDDDALGTRKRKSPGDSHVGVLREEEERGRTFKRPTTRRSREMIASSNFAVPGPLRTSARAPMAIAAPPANQGRRQQAKGPAPDVLRSLLQEVESTEIAEPPVPHNAIPEPGPPQPQNNSSSVLRPQRRPTASARRRRQRQRQQASRAPSVPAPPVPASSVPAPSLANSADVDCPRSSPTPTMAPASRADSPTALTPTMEPLVSTTRLSSPHQAATPDYSILNAPTPGRSPSPRSKGRREQRDRTARVTKRAAPRNELSPEMKLELSELVKTALRPFHRSGKVFKDDYKVINQTVSRKLYGLVRFDTILDHDTKERLGKVAVAEVRKALRE